MIRLKIPRDDGLALPKSTPVTLVEISSESLPYACQCPLCGEVFQIPEALLYKVEDDDFADDDLAEFEEADGSTTAKGGYSDVSTGNDNFGGGGMDMGTSEPEIGGGENASIV